MIVNEQQLIKQGVSYILIYYNTQIRIVNSMQQQQKNNNQSPLTKAIGSIDQKMSLISFQNYPCPYLLHTYSQLKQTLLKPHISFPSSTPTQSQLHTRLQQIDLIIKQLDEKVYDKYSQRLINAYLNKMKNQEWELSGVKFKDIESKYQLKSEGKASVFWIVEWFVEIQRMEEVLARLDLYFGIKVPSLMPHLQNKLSSQIDHSQIPTSHLKTAKKLLKHSLKKLSQIISSPVFTGIVTTGLILTISLLTNRTIPLQMKLNSKCFIPAGVVAFVPAVLDSIANLIEKDQYSGVVKKWEEIFLGLTMGMRRYSDCVEKGIKVCVQVQDRDGYDKQITNLIKIVQSMSIDVQLSKQFEQDKFEEMRKRTQAYFQEYQQIIQGEWTVVLTKQKAKFYKPQSQQFQDLKQSKQLQQLQIKQKNNVKVETEAEVEVEVEAEVEVEVEAEANEEHKLLKKQN